jgi:hypothetical protein
VKVSLFSWGPHCTGRLPLSTGWTIGCTVTVLPFSFTLIAMTLFSLRLLVFP